MSGKQESDKQDRATIHAIRRFYRAAGVQVPLTGKAYWEIQRRAVELGMPPVKGIRIGRPVPAISEGKDK